MCVAGAGAGDESDDEGSEVAWYPCVVLYQNYLKWCESTNEKHLTKAKFSREIKKYVKKSKTRRDGVVYSLDLAALNFN